MARLDPNETFTPERGRDEVITVFEGLMGSIKKHIQEEYDNQRIRGQEYANVFLGSMQSAMTQTVTYLLGMDLSDENKEKLLAEIAQTDYVTETQLPAQVALTQAQTTKTNAEQGLVKEQTAEVSYRTTDLLPAEKAFREAGTAELVYKTANLLPLEGNLLTAQVSKTNAELGLIDAQASQVTAEIGLITAQASKATAELGLINAQVSKTTTEIGLVDAQVALISAQQTTEEAQVSKLNAEVGLINAKTAHESAFLNNLAAQASLTLAQANAIQAEPSIKVYKIQADLTAARWVANGEADTTSPTPPTI